MLRFYKTLKKHSVLRETFCFEKVYKSAKTDCPEGARRKRRISPKGKETTQILEVSNKEEKTEETIEIVLNNSDPEQKVTLVSGNVSKSTRFTIRDFWKRTPLAQ